ncbi:MAG TPA: gamma-glutamylcyclotransferase family protein [Planctomycetaceae bacterium]|jgi:gamma-glutamylcyclotransferase (GGCT)/AIG2-like uncharacterized protein YtfP
MKVPTDPNEHLPLFTFGTLRRGQPNHHYLAETYERYLTGTLRDFRKTTAAHGFPAVSPSPGDCVTGELFFIRRESFEQTLQNCDLLEDIIPGRLIGPYYQRAQVVIETDVGNFTAWAYIDPASNCSSRSRNGD